MCDFGLKIVIFGPFKSLPLLGEKFVDLPNLALKVSSIALSRSGCKISMKNAI